MWITFNVNGCGFWLLFLIITISIIYWKKKKKPLPTRQRWETSCWREPAKKRHRLHNSLKSRILLGFSYNFGKNYGWSLYAAKNIYKMFGYGCFSKVLFTWKCIKIIFFIFKKLFLISAHQNDLKIQKKN